MKKFKCKWNYLLFLIVFLSKHSISATFCQNGQGQVINNNDPVLTGELKNGQCYEIGAHDSASSAGKSWAAEANELIMLNGSKLSVMGYINNSQVQNGAELWIGKVGLIYSDPYQDGIPALGSGIDIQKGGLVYVINGGTLQNSSVNGGRVNVTSSTTSGISINNSINADGVLMVFNGGDSIGTVINSGGLEVLQMNGSSDGTIINSNGSQYVTDDSKATGTIINGGTQTVFLSNTNSTPGVSEDTIIKNGGLQVVQSGAQAINTTLWDNSRQNIRAGSKTTNTSINDDSITIIQRGAQALGETIVNNRGQLQLVTGVSDSTDNNFGAYAEKIKLNSNESTLQIRASENNTTAFVHELDGNGIISFDPGTDGFHSNLVIDILSGKNTFLINTSIAEKKSDFLTINQGRGEHLIKIQDSGVEITPPSEDSLDVVKDYSGNALFELASISGENINSVDGGTYMYNLNKREENDEKIWYLSLDKKINNEQESTEIKRTTPSTDAVLSMASANQFIFDNELQSLRYRKGDVNSNEKQNSGIWGRYLTNHSDITGSNGVSYEIQQYGTEIGGGKSFTLESGNLLAGIFVSFSDNNVKHARGGKSNIKSYGFGGYVTYFDDEGYYLDSVVKVNRFNNMLRARMTSGSLTENDSHQNSFGGAVEAGYHYKFLDNWFVEPYLRTAYFQSEGNKIVLSNGMGADINKNRSLKTEVGSSLGINIPLNNSYKIKPYIHFAVEKEFIKSNKVKINNRDYFYNDFSGINGKYGLGTEIELSSKGSVYSEFNYRNGEHIESPITANIGFSISF